MAQIQGESSDALDVDKTILNETIAAAQSDKDTTKVSADGKWYTTYVDWAAQNDIINGYDSKTFGPDDFITREQMAVILYRYARYRGVDVKAADAAKYHTFRDADQVSSYAKVPMIWATDKGVINGMGDGTLAPKGNSTRSQV